MKSFQDGCQKELRDRSNLLDKATRCNESHHPAVWRIDLGDDFQQHKPLASKQDPVLAERSLAENRFFGTSFDLDVVLLFFQSWFK